MKPFSRSIKKRPSFSHDLFFKSFYSDPKMAQSLLQLIFSKKEQKAYLLNKVKVEKDTFEGKRADLVLSVPFKAFPKKRLELFILLEHKSHYDKNLFEQLLDYLFLIRKSIIKQKGSPRPVLAVLFYHGKEPFKWKNTLLEEDFQGFFEKIPFETRKNMLNYGLRIINTRESKIRKACEDKSFKGRGVIRLLSEIWDIERSAVSKVKEILFDFEELLVGSKGERRKDIILKIREYLFDNTNLEEKTWRQAEAWFIEKGFLTKGGVMDIREYIKEKYLWEGMQKGRLEGQQKGMQKGRLEGRQQVILNMLKKELDISLISEVTGLSEKRD